MANPTRRQLDAAAGAAFAILMAVALFVDRGILQFGGVVDIAGGIPALLWIAALSVVMVLDTARGSRCRRTGNMLKESSP